MRNLSGWNSSVLKYVNFRQLCGKTEDGKIRRRLADSDEEEDMKPSSSGINPEPVRLNSSSTKFITDTVRSKSRDQANIQAPRFRDETATRPEKSSLKAGSQKEERSSVDSCCYNSCTFKTYRSSWSGRLRFRQWK